MYFEYWNKFFLEWRRGNNQVSGWTDPDLVPVLNTVGDPPCGNKDFSSQYVPEPWWGNDGTTPLHCVVMNYNPAAGEDFQNRDAVSKLTLTPDTYAQLTRDSSLARTAIWHRNRRARRVIDALKELNGSKDMDVSKDPLDSHLSVEILPWHSAHIDTDYGYPQYVDQNLGQIMETSFAFAAHESRRISNDRLRNRVIIRQSANILKAHILEKLKRIGVGYCFTEPVPPTSAKLHYWKFRFTFSPTCRLSQKAIVDLSGVEFICIWNICNFHFPNHDDLKEILEQVSAG